MTLTAFRAISLGSARLTPARARTAMVCIVAETWGAMERLVDDGHRKAIVLSDITLEKLREIVAAARIKPAVVQVETHPYLPEWELLEFCREHGIVLLAFAAQPCLKTPCGTCESATPQMSGSTPW